MSNTSVELARAMMLAKIEAQKQALVSESPSNSLWPKDFKNTGKSNAKNKGKIYKPHNQDEFEFVYTDAPRRVLLKGGLGSGKSTAGIIKVLGRLRRGCNGAMLSTDFPHLRKSLWPAFKDWCPDAVVVENQRRYLSPTYDPQAFFTLNFYNELGSTSALFVGGLDDPSGWQGPNINFIHFDEAERHETPAALKVIDARIRISGPKDEPCQLWLTTTPRKHWLYEYFGGIEPGEIPMADEEDPLFEFKKNARTITLKTIENAANLEAGYVDNHGSTYSGAEFRVMMEARWEDIDTVSPFLPPLAWDNCKENFPELTKHDMMVIAIDAGISHDSFGLVAVSPHPLMPGVIAVQAAHAWDPKTVSSDYKVDKGKLDFAKIEEDIRKLIKDWNIVKLVYDEHELHYMASRLGESVLVEPFSQMGLRNVADKQLQDIILQRRVVHRGDTILNEHLKNASSKIEQDRKLRLVKKYPSSKIDTAVCLSMAVHAIREFVPDVKTGYVASGIGDINMSVLDKLRALM